MDCCYYNINIFLLIKIYKDFCFHFELRSDPEPDPRKKLRILIPEKKENNNYGSISHFQHKVNKQRSKDQVLPHELHLNSLYALLTILVIGFLYSSPQPWLSFPLFQICYCFQIGFINYRNLYTAIISWLIISGLYRISGWPDILP